MICGFLIGNYLLTLFTDLPVNITTPVIERTKDAVQAVLDNVKELGTSKFLRLLCKEYITNLLCHWYYTHVKTAGLYCMRELINDP